MCRAASGSGVEIDECTTLQRSSAKHWDKMMRDAKMCKLLRKIHKMAKDAKATFWAVTPHAIHVYLYDTLHIIYKLYQTALYMRCAHAELLSLNVVCTTCIQFAQRFAQVNLIRIKICAMRALQKMSSDITVPSHWNLGGVCVWRCFCFRWEDEIWQQNPMLQQWQSQVVNFSLSGHTWTCLNSMKPSLEHWWQNVTKQHGSQ